MVICDTFNTVPHFVSFKGSPFFDKFYITFASSQILMNPYADGVGVPTVMLSVTTSATI